MAFKKELDKELFHANIECDDGTTLKVSVNSYNGGEAKLQIGPKVYTKKDGSEGFRKAGRLSSGEVEKLADVLPEVMVHLGIDKALTVNG